MFHVTKRSDDKSCVAVDPRVFWACKSPQVTPVVGPGFLETGGTTQFFDKFFAENCMKMKDIALRGRRVPNSPLGPAIERSQRRVPSKEKSIPVIFPWTRFHEVSSRERRMAEAARVYF